jgi:hypothetical protein
MTLCITTENAAFCDADTGEESQEASNLECARILRDIANKLEAGQDCGSCRDVNGNKVGSWSN